MKRTAVAFFTLAFNAERYVAQTIESVLNQSLEDFIYYIRDNGSTDSTFEILQKYAEQDKRIVLFKNEVNGSYGNAHPYSFPFPDSDYVTILDADDYIDRHYAKKLYEAGKAQKADIVVAGTKMFMDGQDEKILNIRTPNPIIYQEGDSLTSEALESVYGQLRPFWGKLFRTDFFYQYYEANQTTYCANVLHAYDTAQSIGFTLRAEKIVFLNEALHYQRIRARSYFYTEQPGSERIYELIYLYKLGMQLLKKFKSNGHKSIQFMQSVARGHLLDLCTMITESNYQNFEYKFDFIEHAVRDERYPELMSIVEYRGFATQFDQLFENLAQACTDLKRCSESFIGKYVYGRYLSKSIYTQKLLLLSAAFDPSNVHCFGIDELFYWQDSERIPKWYMRFCSMPLEKQKAHYTDREMLLELINQDISAEEMRVYMNHVLSLIDEGQHLEAYEFNKYLLKICPLVKELLYFQVVLCGIHGRHEEAMDAKLLIMSYFEQDTHLIAEILSL